MYHINNKTPQKANIDTIETVSSYNSINTINSINSINSVSSIDEVIENYLSIENTMSHISIKDGKSKSYGHSNRSVHSTKNNILMTNNLKIKNLIDDYNNLIESTNSYTLPTGDVTVSVTKNILTYYDWELETNESKRTISLLNERYVTELEKQFKNLMK